MKHPHSQKVRLNLKLLKNACDILATYHRGENSFVTRMAGSPSATVIYVTSDPTLIAKLDAVLPPGRPQSANAEPAHPTTPS
jgi:hypothetical protein